MKLVAGMMLCVFVLCGRVEAQGQTTIDLESNRDALTSSLSDDVSTTIDPDERLPALGARLALDGTMRFYAGSYGPSDIVQIDVTNQGLTPATVAQLSVSFSGYTFSGVLYQYFGGSATTPNTVNGGERGYIRIEVGRGALQECRKEELTVALANKVLKGVVATQCPLRWTTPIDAQRLGSTPDPLIAGKTLQDIVSSRVQGSAKGFCSNCHNNQAGEPPYYRPNIGRGSTVSIEPFDQIGNHIGSPSGTVSWAFGGTNPSGGTYYSWAEWFISRSDKPEGLKAAFSKWLADGSQH